MYYVNKSNDSYRLWIVFKIGIVINFVFIIKNVRGYTINFQNLYLAVPKQLQMFIYAGALDTRVRVL